MDNRHRSSHKDVTQSFSASQQKRREQALQEQKRRRALRVDSSRTIDGLQLSNLSIGESSDEGEEQPQILREGVGHLVPLIADSIGADNPSSSEQRRQKSKARKNKSKSRYADKCMYAELLELRRDNFWDPGLILPPNLQTDWIGLSPVPCGKRSLLVTNQSNGTQGIVPATLHSRLKGKKVMTFPSPLPPNTILDCILDDDWKHNGVIHVLDVIRWHNQDIGDSEATFRFWWRDTRLAETSRLSVPPPQSNANSYEFPYPITFVPVPAYAPLSFSSLLSTVIPAAQVVRNVAVTTHLSLNSNDESTMDCDTTEQQSTSAIQPDGILLYFAQASYETGTSPLSLWIPVHSPDGGDSHLQNFKLQAHR